MLFKPNNAEKFFITLSIVCFLTTATLVIYYNLKYPVESSIGERYVREEIELIPQSLPPLPALKMKPVTLISSLILLDYALLFEVLITKLRKINRRVLKIIFIIFVLFAARTAFEVIWNLFAWFSSWEMVNYQINLDSVSNEIGLNPGHFNFVYITNVFFTFFS